MVEWIQKLTGFGPRRPGSKADLAGEEYLLTQLNHFNLHKVRKEPISIETFEASETKLQLDDGTGYRPLMAHYIPYTGFTPAGGIEAPLVYADAKKFFQKDDWQGKIVVTDIEFPALNIKLLEKLAFDKFDPDGSLEQVNHPATWVRLNWHFYKKAVKSQAAGFVGILTDQPGGSCNMYAPYGFKEKDIWDKPLPGFWVSREAGATLRKLAQSQKGKMRMTLNGLRQAGITHNVIGEIPGESDEYLIISCHHDSPFVSPVEDASGCSVVLALAKHFAIKKPKRTLLFLFSAGHFYGSIGTRSFIKDHAHDLLKKVVLEISIEHIAKEAVEDETGRLIQSGRPEASGIFVPFNQKIIKLVMKAIADNRVERCILLPPEGPLGDYPPTDGGDWYAAGFPLVNFICNPVYLLNEEDDFSWVDQDRLPLVAQAFSQVIDNLDLLSRSELVQTNFPIRRLAMRLLKHLIRAKTTRFGTRPVY